MAVKVMLAPALAKRDEAPVKSTRAGAEPELKRQRSSVYDADGNEVFITLICFKCHKMRPLSLFGIRKMADGAIRNQPWCRTCRSGSSAENPKRQKRGGAADPAAAAAANGTLAQSAPAPAAEKIVDSGTIAAQVVAALHNGRR
jgi:hypothetical protein